MNADQHRKVAVVTGSSSGIGRATAERLAEEGYDLILHGLNDGAGIAEAVAAVRSRGADARYAVGDIRDPSTPAAVIALAEQYYGRLDALVNCAGAGLTKRFTAITAEEWGGIIDMHLGAATTTCRAAYPMLQASRGAVVNVSSLAATVGLPGRVGYGTAKAALEGFTLNLGCEWAPEGIRVNAVAPGTILTPLVSANFDKGLLDEREVLQRTPMNRLGEPSEVAAVVWFLLSNNASYMTGQTLHVDGGWSSWGGWS
ncbi:SDR family oxidoreductase [Saxibacter everestensis]|uniref:SDR family oxidoreductase n=1 Tax=Saxibacter everestensis TaxID=2909229 RepID=A0ABY8QR44_9MICO|nr:SDR family oxidoreductase [Brevibacteriaceae bacterium ZFBP1038]